MSEMTDLFTESDCEDDLPIHPFSRKILIPAVSLGKANRLFKEWLANGIVVFGANLDEGGAAMPITWYAEKWDKATHQGLLGNVRPIEPEDSAERVLSDLLKHHDTPIHYSEIPGRYEKILERARKLLDKDK